MFTKKTRFLLLVVGLLLALCLSAYAEDTLPDLQFTQTDRINYKPVLNNAGPEFDCDTYLMYMGMENEDVFYEAANGEGPVFTINQISGPAIKVEVDDGNVLRMLETYDKPALMEYEVSAEWCGKTTTTSMKIEFFDCTLPTSIGFDSEYLMKIGQTVTLENNFDNGNWVRNTWRSVYPDWDQSSVYDGETQIVSVETEEFEYATGADARQHVTALAPGQATVRFIANQDGLNWTMDVTFTILPEEWKDKDGNIYKISNGKATFSKAAKKVKKVTIPDTLTVYGQKLKVTGIEAKAFKSCKKLTTVTIGKNVKDIGKEAFKGCSKLKTITIKTTKLTSSSVKSNAFKGIYKKATFKCPKKKLAAYKKLLVKKGAPKTCKFK